MSLARVQKQLMRDLKRSPMKAGVLGLLCVVAIWFWAPLVSGWFGKGSKKKAAKSDTVAQQSTAPTSVPPTPAPTPTSSGPPAVATTPWQTLVEWMEHDRRKQSAQLAAIESPPFGIRRPDPADEETQKAETPIASQKSEVNFAELGLKLSSTMLGPRRRVAVINGRPYAEGGELEVGNELVLVVARVTDRSVFLEGDGRQFELVVGDKKVKE